MESEKQNEIVNLESEGEEQKPAVYYAYILQCSDGTLYCGYTNNLEKRIQTHNAGKGAKYTRSRLPVQLVYHEPFDNQHDALSREWHLKRLSRQKKLQLAESWSGWSPEKKQEGEDNDHDL